MPAAKQKNELHVLMVGSFPPQSQGIPTYCGTLATALAQFCIVTAIGFKRMYPGSLFPGHRQRFDPESMVPEGTNLRVRNILDYRNPVGWISVALLTPADVIHVQWWSLPLWPVMMSMMLVKKFLGKKVVVTVHNVEPHETSKWFTFGTWSLSTIAHAILVHGAANQQRFYAMYPRFPRDKVRPVPMILPEVTPTRPKAAAKRALGLSPDSKTVLFFGIIRPYKGLEILLKAWHAVRQQRSDCCLVIAGKPWQDMTPVEQLIRNLDLRTGIRLDIRYIPEDEVPVFLGAADLMVLPYLDFAAQSAVAALAVAANLPVIVSDVGGLPEAVNFDESWIVPRGDVAALSRRILRFLDKQSEEEEAYAKIVTAVRCMSSPDRVARQHVTVYHALRS